MINQSKINNNIVIPEIVSQNCVDLPKDFEREVLQLGLQAIIDSEVKEIKENYQGDKADVQIKRTREVKRTTCYGQVILRVPNFRNYSRRDRQTNSLE